jgi:septum formation protein
MLVLGSASPRRAELLRELGVEFGVCPSGVPEVPAPGERSLDFARRAARQKGRAVSDLRPGDWVLAADTVVAVDGEILGKPVDAADAQRMLNRLSGRCHQVITAVALVKPGGDVCGELAVSSDVHFRSLSAGEIREYVATGEPFDKAGGYGIQGGASRFVERVEGSYSNVVGLPVDEVRELLAFRGLLRAVLHWSGDWIEVEPGTSRGGSKR